MGRLPLVPGLLRQNAGSGRQNAGAEVSMDMLPRHTLEKDIEDEVCPWCQFPMETGQVVINTPCWCNFHDECLVSYLTTPDPITHRCKTTSPIHPYWQIIGRDVPLALVGPVPPNPLQKTTVLGIPNFSKNLSAPLPPLGCPIGP